MLNDTYAVTDLHVLNVDTDHKNRASSVDRASVIKLQIAGSDLNGSFFFFFVCVCVCVCVFFLFLFFFFFFFFFLFFFLLLLSF